MASVRGIDYRCPRSTVTDRRPPVLPTPRRWRRPDPTRRVIAVPPATVLLSPHRGKGPARYGALVSAGSIGPLAPTLQNSCLVGDGRVAALAAFAYPPATVPCMLGSRLGQSKGTGSRGSGIIARSICGRPHTPAVTHVRRVPPITLGCRIRLVSHHARAVPGIVDRVVGRHVVAGTSRRTVAALPWNAGEGGRRGVRAPFVPLVVDDAIPRGDRTHCRWSRSRRCWRRPRRPATPCHSTSGSGWSTRAWAAGWSPQS